MSEPCQRFEQEALERIERGLALEDHFRQCPDCLSAAAVYGRLRSALEQLPAEPAPPQWEARVWAQLQRGAVKRRTWKLASAFALAAAAAAAAAILVLLPPSIGQAPRLEVEVQGASGQRMRGTSAKPGDVLRFRAETGGSPHAELRVYRDGALVFRCGELAPCARQGEALSAELEASAVGRYEPVLLVSDRPIAAPGAGRNIDQDLDDATRQGGKAIGSAPVDVL